jgi:RNA polymerase sigma-70 factor (ECF subfamily)
LCGAYWYPLYAYIRRLGHPPPQSEDLTQSFFAYLLEKGLVARADPGKGHFRSFLLGSLKGFMANEWRLGQALKRGGGAPVISFDARDAEDRYAAEPVETRNPETLYEHAWAVSVLDEAVALLEAEYVEGGKAALFEELHVFLQGARGPRSYAEAGAVAGMTEGAVKVAVHRMRRRCRELLRAVVARTVAEPGEVEEDLLYLQRVLRG